EQDEYRYDFRNLLKRAYTWHSGTGAVEDWYYRYSPGGERDQKRLYAATSPDSVTPYGWVYYVLGARSQLAVYHGQQVSGAAGCGGSGRRVSIYPAEYLTNGIGWNGAREQITQVVTKPSGVKEYQVSDHLASLRVAIEGTAERHIDYTPWGNVLGGTSGGAVTGERQTYNNQEPDRETGLYDLSDRKMDPETGRFVSPDRLMEKFPSVSPYAYCYNNPVRYTDPTGMQAPEEDDFDAQQAADRMLEDEATRAAEESNNTPKPTGRVREWMGPEGETEFDDPEPTPPTMQEPTAESTTTQEAEEQMERHSSGIPPAENLPRTPGIEEMVNALTGQHASGLDDEPGIPESDLEIGESQPTRVRPPGSSTPADILMLGGSPLGQEGSRPEIREMKGGLTEATELFEQLTQGGEIDRESTYSGTMMKLPGGGRVGIRTVASRSPETEVTIDVNFPDVPIDKIKFNP
ncbi:MAG TPA: RHS repeat-associated core domain-containing protein, partial [Candidatus Paceibacterota bacterium]|nr:RHS repeat-associated core domain-containing protein [Candidatus Paceibacterota bacterium]